MSISYFFRGNLAPLVTSLTVAPASVASGANVTFSCAAADLDGSVVSVEYFLDSASKGVSTTSAGGFPLTFAVVAVGANRLTQAQATDNLGIKSLLFTSNALTVTGASSVPSQVGGLFLSSPTTTSLVASWALPASGGAAITDYFVEYSGNGGTSYAAFAHAASTALTQTLTGLAAGTSYLVRVSAINSVGTGAASAVVSISTVAANTAPGAMAQPNGVATSATIITLTYVAPTTGGSPITDYVYSYSSNGGSTYTVFTHTATTALSQAITGLAPGTAYQFHVAAVNSVGTGAASTDLSLSTPPSVTNPTFAGDVAPTLAANSSTPA